MEFVSIGPNCDTANILKTYGLRLKAYPFDYIFSSLELVKHSILDKFRIFLDKKYYVKGIDNSTTTTKHTYYCNFLNTEILQQHHIKNGYSKDYKVSDGNLFNHHDLLNNTIHYEQYQRRCARLLELLESEKKVVFIYYNPYTNTFDDIIEFYNTFSDNKNIYILGIFENNGDRKIIYENKNCRIYQNYDISFVLSDFILFATEQSLPQ